MRVKYWNKLCCWCWWSWIEAIEELITVVSCCRNVSLLLFRVTPAARWSVVQPSVGGNLLEYRRGVVPRARQRTPRCTPGSVRTSRGSARIEWENYWRSFFIRKATIAWRDVLTVSRRVASRWRAANCTTTDPRWILNIFKPNSKS